MKKIELPNGKHILVDDEDFERLNKIKWHTSPIYAQKKIGSKNVYMHRILTNAKKGEVVDHINGNTLDNRKENLRICTHQQNMLNRKACRNNKSGFKGVYASSNKDGKWCAEIKIDKKRRFLGVFPTKELAANEYNIFALKYFGEFANLNKI